MKFIDSWTKDNVTYVTVNYKGKNYTGKATCHAEDHFNPITGGRIAMSRAEIAAYKDELRTLKAELKTGEKLISAVKCYKDFDNENTIVKHLYKQQNVLSKKIDKLAAKIRSAEFWLKKSLKTKEAVDNKIASKLDN